MKKIKIIVNLKQHTRKLTLLGDNDCVTTTLFILSSYYHTIFYRNYLKLRSVHIAVGTILTRYYPKAPFLVIIFVDRKRSEIRSNTFSKNLMGFVPQAIHIHDIVVVQGASIEPSDSDSQKNLQRFSLHLQGQKKTWYILQYKINSKAL